MKYSEVKDLVYGTQPKDGSIAGLTLLEDTLREQLDAKIESARAEGNADAVAELEVVRGDHMAARVMMGVSWAVLVACVVLAFRSKSAWTRWALASQLVITFALSVRYARQTKRASMYAASFRDVARLNFRLGAAGFGM